METPLTLGEQTGLHGTRCAGSRGRTKPWSGAGPELRAAQRASQAAPILARLHRVLNAWKTSGTHLPASSMGQAIDYALGQWNLLGHADCGQHGAILFTIVQACRQRGINPFDYLKDVLTQIPHHTNKTVAQLTPENCLKNRQPHAARAA